MTSNIKQYVYLIFDRFAELPVGTLCTNTPPEAFVELQNRQNMRQPMLNAESLDIYLVAEFDNGLAQPLPFNLIGDLSTSCAKIKEAHPDAK